MKIDDIDFNSDKYDAQRGLGDMRKCIKIWDFDALFEDLRQCDDYNTIDMRWIMQKGRGSFNPKEISDRL